MCSDQVCGAVVGQIEERVAGIQRCLTWWRNTRVWIMSRVIWAWGRIGRGDGLGDTMNDSVARHVGWWVRHVPRCLHPNTRSIQRCKCLLTNSLSRACRWYATKASGSPPHHSGSATFCTWGRRKREG